MRETNKEPLSGREDKEKKMKMDKEMEKLRQQAFMAEVQYERRQEEKKRRKRAEEAARKKRVGGPNGGLALRLCLQARACSAIA